VPSHNVGAGREPIFVVHLRLAKMHILQYQMFVAWPDEFSNRQYVQRMHHS
jgi:hypothetical protein